jgi:hypothetical protein
MAEDERKLTHRTQHTRPLSALTQGTVHRKKKVLEFPVPSRDDTTKLSLGGNNDVITELFLPRGSLVSDIPAGDGKLVNLFLRCICHDTELYKCQQCCYLTVDFATATGTSQNGSSTYPLSLHKKITILIRKLQKKHIIFFLSSFIF